MDNQTKTHKSYMPQIIILSICFFGIFFAFNTSQALQTTVNKRQGYINLGCLYGVFSIFSIFGPKVVSLAGPKWSMIIGGVTYACAVASNLRPEPVIQVIANLAVGVGAAMLWNAQGVYLGRCAVWDSRTSSRSFAETTSSFNGVFFAIFQFSGFAGTLISGIIKHFTNNNTILFIILTLVGVISVFSLSFLPNVESYSAPGQEEKNDSVSFNETFRLLCSSVKLLMILPLIIYNGMSLAFIFGDIPTGISNRCFGGSWNLYTTAIFYLANAFFSYIFGKCVEKKWMSRTVMCLIAFFCQVASFCFIIFYHIPDKTTNPVDLPLALTMVVVLSAGDAVWESQPPAILQSFYGKDSERNAAMANYKMWQSLGWCAQFVLGVIFNKDSDLTMKAIILLSLLVVGYIFLVILDKRVAKLDMKKGESAALLAGYTDPTTASVSSVC